MKQYQVKLKILGLPKRINQGLGCHWKVIHGERTKWTRKVGLSIGLNRPSKPLDKAKLKLTRHSSREPDFDGLVSSFKHILDALIKHGIIEDDKMSVIGQPIYKHEKTTRGRGFIEIEIEELNEI